MPDDGVKYRDPKDIPYILLQRRIEASIVTSDKDVAAMDGRVVPIAVMATLRAYSRAAAVQATLQVGGYTLSSFGLSTLVGMTRVASSGVKKMATNVPREVWLALLGMLCVALVIPASRNWLQSRMHTLAAHLGTAGEGLLSFRTCLQRSSSRISLRRPTLYQKCMPSLTLLQKLRKDRFNCGSLPLPFRPLALPQAKVRPVPLQR